jgi:hypothetical protein
VLNSSLWSVLINRTFTHFGWGLSNVSRHNKSS